jgi:hypothetical protein
MSPSRDNGSSSSSAPYHHLIVLVMVIGRAAAALRHTQPRAIASSALDVVPSLNTDKAESIASMDKVRRLIAAYKAKFFINHDKSQTDKLKLLPAFYD